MYIRFVLNHSEQKGKVQPQNASYTFNLTLTFLSKCVHSYKRASSYQAHSQRWLAQAHSLTSALYCGPYCAERKPGITQRILSFLHILTRSLTYPFSPSECHDFISWVHTMYFAKWFHSLSHLIFSTKHSKVFLGLIPICYNLIYWLQ